MNRPVPGREWNDAHPGYGKVFVVGCARSGTTWTRSILAQHPDVVSGEESHAFDVLYSSAVAAGRKRHWEADVLDRFDQRAAAAKESYGGTGPHRWIERGLLESVLTRAGQLHLAGEACARLVMEAVFGAFYEANGGGVGKILVEKTPRHLMYADQILRWWPEARFVELVRDGRDVCVSLEFKSRVETWASDDRKDQVRRWIEAVTRGDELAAHPLAAGRWHRVRYEDLITNGAEEVGRLYDFVGLGHDDDTIAKVVDATSFANAARPGTENHLRKGVVGDWRNHFDDEDRRLFDELAGDVLTAMGYER